ncbi:MAG: DUF2161 family putative PD-(D/E)XK-type phosphodiesterase [Eubacteriales bacterium]|nr:DUF2161 family putative PD-(D/E)XK-type phosphodiesterase [Eubacteriales bacterium]
MSEICEKDMFRPVSDFFAKLGYDVKGEVKDCDITAVKGDELVIVELKKSFNLQLLFQIIERQKSADIVYAAIPRPNKGYKGKRWRDIQAIAKRLEFGIIVVAFTQAGPFVEIALHPKDYAPPKAKSKKRKEILKEHLLRTGSQNIGGVSKTKLMTVYRERSLHIATLLDMYGDKTPKELRALGGCDKTASILYRNFYKWFKKQGTTYGLTEEGKNALLEYKELSDYFREKEGKTQC